MIHSCTKDNDLNLQGDNASLELRDDNENVFIADDSNVETILGQKLPCNPYTVDIVTEAWNNLYPARRVAELPASHKYIKFSPSDGNQIYELYKDPKLVVWDHPLDYEIQQMGDYYRQPGKAQNDMPDLYSVIDIDYNLNSKGIEYQKIEELIKVPYDTPLSAEAFRLCNIKHIKVSKPETGGPFPPPCTPSDPDWPECLNPPDPPPPPDDPNDPVNPNIPQYCECTQYHNGQAIDNWIVQLEEGERCEDHEEHSDITGEGIICNSYTPPPIPANYVNSCGCPFNYHPLGRKSAGCVKVESPDGSGFVPVRNAKVLIRNTSCYDCPNTVFDILWTEAAMIENGCWKIDKECYGKIWVWVQFINEKAFVGGNNFSVDFTTDEFGNISGTNFNGNFLNYFKPVTDYVGEINGPNFSNIQVNYSRWTIEGSQTQRYWCAATTVNAVEEMHDLCNIEGINTPPHMDIYLASDITGAAWMAHYWGVSEIIWAHLLDQLIGGFAGNAFNFPSSFILPDIFLDRNAALGNFVGTAYHEFAHASHFTQVGANWWQHLTQFEFDHGGHGDNTDNNDPDAGYCAVAESWADHIGDLFDQGNPNISNLNERLDWEPNGWIPEGLHYDLYDDYNSLEHFYISDNVKGFTNKMIFDVLDENTTTIPEMRTKLWNDYNSASGVATSEVDYLLLFNDYGY